MKLRSIKPNMAEVELGSMTVLFSYQTPVACHIEGQGYFRTSHKWSATTTRHINKWLGMMGAREPKERPQDFFDSLINN